MKKVTPRFARWLSHRRKASLRIRRPKRRSGQLLAKAWDGVVERTIIIDDGPIDPEPILCFDENFAKTAHFLAAWQARIYKNSWANRANGTWLK